MPSILILEDETALAEMWARYLRRQGFAVDCFSEIEGALAFYRLHEVDLVVSDMRLKDGDRQKETGGMLFLSRMWSETVKLNRKPPRTVALSGTIEPVKDGKRSQDLLLEHGMVDLSLEKPIELAELHAQLTALLQKRD